MMVHRDLMIVEDIQVILNHQTTGVIGIIHNPARDMMQACKTWTGTLLIT